METTDSERVCINDLKHRPTNSNKQTNIDIFCIIYTLVDVRIVRCVLAWLESVEHFMLVLSLFCILENYVF